MSIDPVHATPFVPPAPAPAPASDAPARTSFADALQEATEPARDDVPDRALEAVRVAGDVYEQLRAADRELRFAPTAHGVRIDVYDGDGRLVQRVPPTEVLDLAAGEQTWLA